MAFIFFLFLNCSSEKKSTKIKDEVKSYHNLFVITNTADIIARVRLEKELAAAAELKNHKVVKSMDVMPISLNNPKPPSIEEFANKVKESGCDAFIIFNYIRKGESINHTPGTNFKGTDPILTGLVAGILGYVGGGDGTEYKKSISNPGTYSKEGGFYI